MLKLKCIGDNIMYDFHDDLVDYFENKINGKGFDSKILKEKFLKIKLVIDSIVDVGEVERQDLEKLKSTIDSVLEIYNTSANQTLENILKNVNFFERSKISKKELLLKFDEYSLIIEENNDDWIVWYMRENR